MWHVFWLFLFSLPLIGQEAPTTASPDGFYEEGIRWQTTDDIEGRFSITIPGPFDHRIDTLTTAVGEQLYHTYFYQVPKGERAENLIYVLSYVDYPEGTFPADSTDLIASFFTATEESAAETLRGEIVYATDRQTLGFPGRLWRINYRDGEATARTLAFLVDRRYYELKTFALTNSGLGESTDRFFDSFRYLGRSPANP
jgi:hypothetical protein